MIADLVNLVLAPRQAPACAEHLFVELMIAKAERDQLNRAARRGCESYTRRATK